MLATALLLAHLAASPAADPPAASVRVLTYNIHHGEGTDGKLDLERIAKVVSDAKPDVVLLQEVDRGTTRTKKVDQAAELARLTKLKAAFGKAIDFQGGEYGQAILARAEPTGVKVHPLPMKKGQEARVVLEAHLDLGGGLPSLTVLGTHFQHDHAATREEQAAKVNELFGRLAGPAVLAGDLNAVPDSPPLKTLGERWAVAKAFGGNSPTIPSDVPTKQIDFVLYRPATRFKVVEVQVIEEKVASDHRPVLAVLAAD
jgi:endonuclease/exonuclease/phosphatase family metal-dependent hydrolase